MSKYYQRGNQPSNSLIKINFKYRKNNVLGSISHQNVQFKTLNWKIHKTLVLYRPSHP